MINKGSKNLRRNKRHLRLRKKVIGTSQRPRLSVYRSEKNIYAQIIDDVKQVTIVASSTLDKSLGLSVGSNKEAAYKVGEAIAKKAIDKGIKSVVFDRGGYIYHGRIENLANGAREAGLEF